MGGSMPAGSSGSELCEVCVCVVCVCVCVCVCTHVHTYITCVYAHICTHIAAAHKSYYNTVKKYAVGKAGAAGGISASVLTGRAIATAARR